MGGKVGENPAALRAAVFSLASKNLRGGGGGAFKRPPPSKARVKEHKRDLRNDMDHSAFVVHAHKTHHFPNWDRAMIPSSCKTKGHRKATEAAFIATNDTINTRVGFIKWAKPAALFGVRYLHFRVKNLAIVLFSTLYLIIFLYIVQLF